MTTRRTLSTLLASCVLLPSCAEPPEGVARTPRGNGPRIVWEPLQEPLPELPLPNDIATRPDPTSPTGKRLNASILAPTEFEVSLREKLNRLTGWGIYQPITLSFDAPIDLESLLAGHRDFETRSDGRDYVYEDDVLYLINVDPDSEGFGEFVPLDFGDGNFPDNLRAADLYFEADPKTTTPVLLYETFDEDRNGNGELDPGEDIDMDGRLDKPNIYPMLDGDPEENIYRDVPTFWDSQSNTLTARPLMPLYPKTEYAVVVTDELLGTNGEPVRSPFAFVNHTDQTDQVRRAVQILSDEVGKDAGDVAFAWSFTTQAVHDDMVAIRDGLYGAGSMSWLAEDFPAEIQDLHVMRDATHWRTGEPVKNPYIVPGEDLARLVAPLAQDVFGAADVSAMESTHAFPDYHISGTFETPYFLDMDGEDPRFNGVWPTHITDPSMRERVGRRTVYFWCTIPRWQYKRDAFGLPDEGAARAKVAPVVTYGHGYGLNRLEHLGGFTTSYNKWGIAGCALDAVDHGIELDQTLEAGLKLLLLSYNMEPAIEPMTSSRARDIDGDGNVDSGDTFFGVDSLRVRDSFRQSVLDYMMLVRLLRSFDGQRTMPFDVDGDGQNELAGDFDGDGNVDLGGWPNDYFATGTSLGGIISSILAGIEPSYVAAAPVSGGAGLPILAIKSEQGGAFEPFSLQSIGPAFIGVRDQEMGGTQVYQLYANGNDDERTTITWLGDEEIQPGDVVVATNLDTDESRCAKVLEQGDIPDAVLEAPGLQPGPMRDNDYWSKLPGSFRVSVPVDRGSRVRLEILRGSDSEHLVDVEPDSLDCHVRPNAEVRTTIDEWDEPVSYKAGAYAERVDYAPGDALRALEHGLGLKRANPLFRRFVSLAATGVEAGDPVAYAPYYSQRKLTYREGDETFESPPKNVLDVVTIGDFAVPVSVGVNIARAAGYLDVEEPDARYGKTLNRVLVDEEGLEGISFLQPFPGFEGQLMDYDNYSQSTPDESRDGFDNPRLDPPLRAIFPTEGGDGVSGLSLPMPEGNGQHAWIVGGHSQWQVFDVGMYMANQVGWYFHTRGREVVYETCMEEIDGCDWIPKPLAFPEDPCEEDLDCQSESCIDDRCAWPDDR